MKNIILIIIIIILLFTFSSCSEDNEESNVMKIIPYNEEKNQEEIVQIYLPNINLSCLITELTTIKGITKDTYIERSIERMIMRSLESKSFIDMNIINIIKSDIVDETVFLTIEWKDNVYINEEEECLILYSLVNTVTSMDGVEYVKIINGTKDFFFSKYNINEALSPSNTILYKDYLKPINSVDEKLNSFFDNANIYSDSSEESISFIEENLSEYIGYNIRNYYYNQYNTLLTVTIEATFYNEKYNRSDEVLHFLLEYNNGKFRIREIY